MDLIVLLGIINAHVDREHKLWKDITESNEPLSEIKCCSVIGPLCSSLILYHYIIFAVANGFPPVQCACAHIEIA